MHDKLGKFKWGRSPFLPNRQVSEKFHEIISPAGNRKNLDELFKFWRKHEIWYTGSFDQYKEI